MKDYKMGKDSNTIVCSNQRHVCGFWAVRQLKELVKWTRQGGPGNQGRDQAVRNAINMRRGAWNEVQVSASSRCFSETIGCWKQITGLSVLAVCMWLGKLHDLIGVVICFTWMSSYPCFRNSFETSH